MTNAALHPANIAVFLPCPADMMRLREALQRICAEHWLYVREGETFASAFADAHVGVLLEEGLRLGLKRMHVKPCGVALDLVEVEPVVEDILADEVDFVLPLSIPPATHLRVGGLFRELPAEIAFKGIAGEGVDVAPRKRLSTLSFPVTNAQLTNGDLSYGWCCSTYGCAAQGGIGHEEEKFKRTGIAI